MDQQEKLEGKETKHKVLFSKVIKRYCAEICRKDNCGDCHVDDLAVWMSKHVVLLCYFQGSDHCVLNENSDLLAMFSMDKCLKCEYFKHNSEPGQEQEVVVRENILPSGTKLIISEIHKTVHHE